MRISILTTDPGHPVVESLAAWQEAMSQKGHEVSLHFDKKKLGGGDILFLVSCSEIIRESERNAYTSVLVLHASDLPKGRGWSPHIWAIVGGENKITVSLLEANDTVDSGCIWLQQQFELEGHELLPEINAKLFSTELELMTKAVEGYDGVDPRPQVGDPGEYMKKRTIADSELQADRSLAEQFDLLRVVDNERYPAFFDYRGHRYLIKIEKLGK
jgi:methionyl-tRNA formyltransferase